MLNELRPALYITYREVRDQLRDWRIIFPIIGLTLFFPFLMNFTAQQALGFVAKYGANIIGERMVPFLLMIVGFFPISVSLVIALETFVGEKERGSIEPLLHTPLKDWQLYLGKLLSSIIPPLMSSFLGMAVYIIGLYRSHIAVPEPALLFQIICLTVIQAVMMVSGAVVVSAQTTSVRAANLLASFIIIPSALLIQGESVVMFWGNYQTLWWAVFGLGVLSLLFVRVGLAHFRREELLGREIDVLNLRWAWGIFIRNFKGDALTLREWYRIEVPKTLRRLVLPALLMGGMVILALLLGEQQTSKFMFSLKSAGVANLRGALEQSVQRWPEFSLAPVLAIWWQNTRVLLLSFVLGLFSFGILGVLPTMFSMGIAGYLMGLLSLNGISPMLYLVGFILPHGVVEIPAAIIASAAVLNMGAVLATPNSEKTIGEVWLAALADWIKVMLAVVLPMLLVAAALEAWVTPRLALWLFR